jgi:diguanylate cyclase (GGDEF)-like protein
MSGDPRPRDHFEALRQRAEQLLAHGPPPALDASGDIRELVHELNLHQAELELQNQELMRAHDELTTLQREYQDLYEFAPFGYLMLDVKGVIKRANLGACRLLRATRSQLLRSTVSPFLRPESLEPYVLARRRARQCDETVSVELQLAGERAPDAWVQADLRGERDDRGEVVRLRVALLDVSARKRAESEALSMQRRLEAALADMSEGIFISDEHGDLVHMNQVWIDLHRCTAPEDCAVTAAPAETNLELLLPNGRPAPESARPSIRALRGETALDQEYQLRDRASGETRVVAYNLAPIRDTGIRIVGAVLTVRDITDAKVHEAALDRAAHHDPLTGLPNRFLLGDRLEQAIALADRTRNALAVCFLDLDGFKALNDEYGHAAGDQFLIKFAAVLRQTVRTHDSVARLGGDEFVLLLSEIQSPSDCFALLDRLLARIHRPVQIGGKHHQLSASIGVTLYPHDPSDADALLRHADRALYRAKDAGRNRYQLFDSEADAAAVQRRSLNDALTRALERDEFVLEYQPQIDLISREVIGAEALIRWRHPDKGLLPPAAFLPGIEGGPLESKVGDWVIATALRQLAQWQRQGLHLRLGVNVGIGHLTAPGFVQRLADQLNAHADVAPEQLELEIVESAAVEDFDKTQQIMADCRALGVRFALDDFGTGYASLAYFRLLPVDRLKIDQSFVRDMLEDRGDRQIAESVVRLSQAFDREVIAEGVETLEHSALLTWLGCRHGQGFGIARPMPEADLQAWIKRWSAQPSWPRVDETRCRADIALMVAAQDHLYWCERVTRLLEEGESLGPAVADKDQCAFGRWLRGAGSQQFGGLSDYGALVDAHDQIHALADACARPDAANRPGQDSGAWRAEFRAARDALLARMRALAHKVEPVRE